MRTTHRSDYRLFSAYFLVFCLLAWPTSATAQSEWIDSPMYHDPDLPLSTVEYILPEATWRLWLKALERPEADFRCKAADAIALAHRRGFEGLKATIPSPIITRSADFLKRD